MKSAPPSPSTDSRRRTVALFATTTVIALLGGLTINLASLLQNNATISNIIWRNNSSFTDYADMLNNIPTDKRVGPDPITLIMEYFKWRDEGGNPSNVQLVQSPDGQVVATVERVGLQDDSLSAIRYRFYIQRQANGQWEIKKAGQQFRCQAGRGHQNWAETLCS
jgi:hypothetical protein